MLPLEGIKNYHDQSNHGSNWAVWQHTAFHCTLNYQHRRKLNVNLEIWLS